MVRKKQWMGILSMVILLTGPAAMGQISVPRLVSDGMVLQREQPIHIWGFGSPGEHVTVKFDGETAEAVTDDNGRWAMALAPRKAGGPYTMDIDGINHIWLKNIMVGEVWFCGGEYPMYRRLGNVKEKYADLISRARQVPIYQFRIETHYDFRGPRRNLSSGRWEAADSASVLSFSELAYLFAIQVYNHYHVPVGLIDASVAEAPAEAWLSPEGPEGLNLFPEYSTLASRYADSSYAPGNGPVNRKAPGGLFNGMVAPADLYTVRGILWCQGDANLDRPQEYQRIFSTLISDWRVHWHDGDLPWIYAQLGPHGAPVDTPQESGRAELRDAQRRVLGLPFTGMAVAADLGERDDGDVADKEELAKRLFLSAEHIAYQKQNMIFSGPLFHSIHIRHNKAILGFDEVNGGLIVKGGGELHGFALAGPDNHFYAAVAAIEGKRVIVTSDHVPNPVTVRYGWADNPQHANLYNRDQLFQDGLPAPAFQAQKLPK
ncbi:MAG TPA: sialate O-acetylesterase [Puia sp.]|nr:sialate O-acetylesterase [Puia sp.]